MTGMRSGRLAGAGITLSILLTAAGAGVHAQPSVIAGQAVGHAVLGMQRADVWKVLKKPTKTFSMTHGGSRYGEDDWTGGGYTLTVVSEQDKVIQVEFESPRMTTTDGLTMKSTLAQIRRLHPAMTAQVYLLYSCYAVGDMPTGNSFYLDDVRRGIAFTTEPQEGIVEDSLNNRPDSIIIHRPGRPAVPIFNGHWSAVSDDADGLSLLRSWFTPGGARRGGN